MLRFWYTLEARVYSSDFSSANSTSCHDASGWTLSHFENREAFCMSIPLKSRSIIWICLLLIPGKKVPNFCQLTRVSSNSINWSYFGLTDEVGSWRVIAIGSDIVIIKIKTVLSLLMLYQ